MDSDYVPDPSIFRSTVGALQYATLTRPEISYSVNKVCQFLSQPLEDHWTAVKRILTYLKGTIHHDLLIQPAPLQQPLSLIGFCDANGPRNQMIDVPPRACVYLGPNLIARWSKKQTMVATSSAEAEYRSLVNLSAEILCIQSLLAELKISIQTPKIFAQSGASLPSKWNLTSSLFEKRC